MATFNPNRKTGGTIQLIKDADGNYSTQEVGFNELTSLSLPDFKTTTTTKTTTTEAKDATEITGDTIGSQTQLAFNMDSGGDNQPDTTGEMLQKSAEQTSKALTDTFADTRGLMTSDDAYRGITSPLEIKAADERISAKEAAPQEDIGTGGVTDFVNYQDAILRGQVGTKAARVSKFGDNLFNFEPKGVETARGRQPVEFTDAATRQAMTTDEAMRGKESMTRDEMLAGATTNEGFTLDTKAAKEADFASGTLSKQPVYQDAIMRGDTGIKPVKRSALETVSTSLRTTKDSVLNKIKTPMMMVLDAVATPRNETEAAVDFNKRYFNVREDGRIAGNPATDLFAGMNRVSAFGNLNQAGAKRIARREKTIATKNVSQKFIDDTNKMKEQLNDYREGRARDRDEKSGGRTKTNVTGFGKTGLGRDTDYMGQGGGSSNDGGKSIVCTAMYQTTGLQDWAKAMKIWYIYQKRYLTIQHQEGYHKLFKPFVKAMHKSNIVKAIGAHFAKHRTQHLKHVLFKSKPSLLGKVYSKVLETICYWAGKK